MTRQEIVSEILKNKAWKLKEKTDFLFAPINIALVKYWGKRDEELHLPMSTSVSMRGKNLGSKTKISTSNQDTLLINNSTYNNTINSNSTNRIFAFLDLFRNALNIKQNFQIETYNNFPTAAGIASSASGFAALTLAINELFNLKLSERELSILARLGSGSACRSVVNSDFAVWNKGILTDGMDSFAEPVKLKLQEKICMFVAVVSTNRKKISSSEAMKNTTYSNTINSNNLKYEEWLRQTEVDAKKILQIERFDEFGELAENNAIMMHAAIQAGGINYFEPKTYEILEFVSGCRKDKKMDVYATIDAGPNVKLIVRERDKNILQMEFLKAFPGIKLLEI
ncbi:MAG: diphosphomevalonate decarboxylase [Rickettsiales bacterium]|nr:diphosphomevalonate decarboxylase [Rickettsiales bacterium]